MPTIEIVCLGCETIPKLPTFSTFSLLAETELKSHRGMFQPVFEASKGFIVHLVNKGAEKEDYQGSVSAGALIKWDGGYIRIPCYDPALGEDQWRGEDQDTDFHFLPTVVPELWGLLEFLSRCSPTGQLYFSTDYQFGPGEPTHCRGYTRDSFFDEHEELGLRFNCLYHITG